MTKDTIYELRSYTLHPGQRDVFIELFEREFVESQEAVGAHIFGTFRDLDRPDCFVWIRSFADMPARGKALEVFYSGPVWAAHRDAANATMIDSDNVLLLHPVGGVPARPTFRPPIGSGLTPETLFVTTIYPLRMRAQEGPFSEYFGREIAPMWQEAGAEIIVTFLTEHSENNFPRLPVRQNECVFVSLMRFGTIGGHVAAPETIETSSQWRRQSEPELRSFLAGPAETLRLQPTARSLLR